MPGDLVGGSYPLTYNIKKLLGAVNATQGNVAARSNLEWPIGTLQDAAASLVSGSLTLVAVPVEYGDVYTAIDVRTGATAASTPTHSWAALYSGVITKVSLVGTQSTDSTTTAIAASTTFTYKLGAAYVANPTDSPNGYLYVALAQTGTTVCSLVSGTMPTATAGSWYTNQPPALAATIAAAGGTAPATVTLASTAAIASVPVVVLR